MNTNAPPHEETSTRHAAVTRGKETRGLAVAAAPPSGSMSELAKQIIRQQWPLRNHADPMRRGQARSLIRTHVILLRSWRESAARLTPAPLSR